MQICSFGFFWKVYICYLLTALIDYYRNGPNEFFGKMNFKKQMVLHCIWFSYIYIKGRPNFFLFNVLFTYANKISVQFNCAPRPESMHPLFLFCFLQQSGAHIKADEHQYQTLLHVCSHTYVRVSCHSVNNTHTDAYTLTYEFLFDQLLICTNKNAESDSRATPELLRACRFLFAVWVCLTKRIQLYVCSGCTCILRWRPASSIYKVHCRFDLSLSCCILLGVFVRCVP